MSAYHPTVETVGFPGLHFVMKDRPIQVEQSCRTGAVVFTTETKTKEEKRQEVLAKLSPEERQILGLEEPKQ